MNGSDFFHKNQGKYHELPITNKTDAFLRNNMILSYESDLYNFALQRLLRQLREVKAKHQ